MENLLLLGVPKLMHKRVLSDVCYFASNFVKFWTVSLMVKLTELLGTLYSVPLFRCLNRAPDTEGY